MKKEGKLSTSRPHNPPPRKFRCDCSKKIIEKLAISTSRCKEFI